MGKTIHLLIKRPEVVDREVRIIVAAMFPDFDYTGYVEAFDHVRRLFAGEISGFEACDTRYHDWKHTLGTLLTTARLLHGIHVDRQALSPRIVELSLVAALFHDAGYIRRCGECDGTGARFTRGHVERGIELLEEYADSRGWGVDTLMDMESMIQCTDPARSPDAIVFTNIEAMLAAHALGSADIVSQMADDVYLEKLPLLFREFVEGGVTDFASEYDLFRKIVGFHSFIRSKLEDRMSNVIAYMPSHFRERHGVERDFYLESMQKNIDYLSKILETYGEEYGKGLRRDLDRPEYPISIAA